MLYITSIRNIYRNIMPEKLRLKTHKYKTHIIRPISEVLLRFESIYLIMEYNIPLFIY
jgi:hypothetical protein